MFNKGRDFLEMVELGRGREGTVYRARQSSLNRHVILKIQKGGNRQERNALLARAAELSTVRVQGVPAIYDAFPRKGYVWTVMEWLEALPLSNLLDTGIPLDQKLFMAAGIASILSEIHKSNWTHGDLKPTNILVTPQGELRIVDLGFAKPQDVPQPREISGTLAYMAPEVLMNRQTEPVRADLYSLGVLLYEILSAQRPKPGYVAQKSIADISIRTNEVISQCMQERPENRPPSAKVVEEVLISEFTCPANEISSRLAGMVAPKFRFYLSQRCVIAAREPGSVDRSGKYHLLREAIDLDPDNTEAIELLEKLPSSKTVIRWRLAFGLLGGIAACILCVRLLLPTHGLRRLVPSESTVVKHEYLEGIPGGTTRAPKGNPLLVMTEKEETMGGEITIRSIPPRGELFLDGKSIAPGKETITLPLGNGMHQLHLLQKSDTVWQTEVEMLPFKKIEIDFSKERSVQDG